MRYYSIYGGRLSSELELLSLHETEPGPVNWTLSVSSDAPPPWPESAEVISEIEIDEGIRVRLSRSSSSFRLEYTDTGIYEVRSGGAEITWYPATDAPWGLVELDLIGRVLALSLFSEGRYCLHSSAVELAEGAVAFVAPSGTGKSTTALSLVRAGARLITDDVLVTLPDPPPRVVPGVQAVRLREDSAAAVGVRAEEGLVQIDEKIRVGDFSREQLLSESVALAAVYELVPVVPDPESPPVSRDRFSPSISLIRLLAQAKIGNLLGGSAELELFGQAAALANSVPVYRLSVTRDLDRLPEVVEQIMAWHGGAPRDLPVGALAS